MGKQWAFIVLTSLILSAATVQAGFEFNYTVTPGTGALTGNNIFALYAKNDQSGEQLGSKKLLVFDIHIKPLSQSLIFDFQDIDGDSLKDANVSGKNMSESNITGTFLRTGDYANWAIASVKPAMYKGSQGDPVASYLLVGVTDFNLVGLVLGPANAPDATQGLGAFYGAAVVPAGVDVNVSGLVAAEYGGISGTPAPLPGDVVPAADPPTQGPNFNFNFTAQAPAPEPGTLALLGLPAVALIARRRRH
jgi:hypothetical protein